MIETADTHREASAPAPSLMDGRWPAAAALTTQLVRPLGWVGCRYFAADWTREPRKLALRDLERVEVTWSEWAMCALPGGSFDRRARHRPAETSRWAAHPSLS
jgi:hypothetical protein